MTDDFRERLAEIGPDRRERERAERRERQTASPRTIDEMDGVVRKDGVLVVDRSLADLIGDEALSRLVSDLDRTSRSILARDDVAEEVRQLLRNPDRALFIDTETTGLAGNMVFLLGAMRVGRGDVRLTQVFARDYREERALLDGWLAMLEGAGMLVSFNGKSFDLPVLRDRLGLHGFDRPEEPLHLDLLHHARRRWRETLPDCRLQTLEWRICGRKRAGDIPGEEIPAVYHHFVRTGDPTDILTVFHHNALDLITLADVALNLAAPEDGPA